MGHDLMRTDQPDETTQVVRWRFQQLVIAGADAHSAQIISERLDIPLHQALELLERDCSPQLMVRILL